MDLFDAVHEQMDTVRLSLIAVTVTTARRPNTLLMAILHWHEFRRVSSPVLSGVDIPPRSVPGSAIWLAHAWQSVEAVDEALLNAVWQLGTWDLERVERRGYNVVSASVGEALACRQAFGDYKSTSADEALTGGTPDRAQLMRTAANEGYLRWLFRPARGDMWQVLEEPGDTLDPDGGREPSCSVLPAPRQIPRHRPVRSRTVYRLGAVQHILLP